MDTAKTERFKRTESRQRFFRKRMIWTVGIPILLAVAFTVYCVRMPGKSHAGPLPPLSAAESEIRDRLQQHVRALAADIGERNVWNPKALEAAAKYIEARLGELGYAVSPQEFTAAGQQVRNLQAEIRGQRLPGEIVLVGAHYDSAPGTPGANDNATGVAALLELARLFRGRQFARTIRLVAFVNEEPPFFQSGEMGSWVCARRCRQQGDNLVAMLSLETIGYYTDAADSQQYPWPLSWLYPSTGNFIAFVGNTSSRALVHQVVQQFREETRFPADGIAAPGAIPGLGWSDHWAFWQEGYPGIMVTDTALFRYRHYHTGEDTPEKVDYGRTARVVAGVARVVAKLAGPAGTE